MPFRMKIKTTALACAVVVSAGTAWMILTPGETPNPRPGPAEETAGDGASPAGSTPRKVHPPFILKVEDHTGYDRKSWPVSGGVPFPKGMVRNPDEISIKGCVSQKRVLSRWSDGTVKWVLLDYQADIPARSTAGKTVCIRKTAPPPLPRLASETDGKITVDTGALRFIVPKNGFRFIDEAWLDVNRNGEYEASEKVVGSDAGKSHFVDLQDTPPERPAFRYRIRNLLTGETREFSKKALKKGVDKPCIPGGPVWMKKAANGATRRYEAAEGTYHAEVVENGPMRTVIKLSGTFGAEKKNRYTIWIHAYKGRSFIRVQHNFVFTGDCQKDFIRRIGLMLPIDFRSKPVFSAAGMTEPVKIDTGEALLFNKGPRCVLNLEYKGFPLDWEIRANGQTISKGRKKTGGWIDVSDERFGVTAAIANMAYMYPKELSYDGRKKTITAWLWPDHGDLVLDTRLSGWADGMQGISFSHDIYYYFHGPAGAGTAGRIVKAFNDTPRPYVNREWYGYRGTKAAGMLMPVDDTQFPKTEAYLATTTAFIYRSMTEFGWLGMLRYGNLMGHYGEAESNRIGKLRTWGIAKRRDDYAGFRNGNTAISSRMFFQYLHTGEYEYWKAADAHLKCIRDVMIKHYNAKKPKWTGMGRRHSAYWGVGKKHDQHGGVAMDGYGTNWLGLYLHWNLTGDWRTYEVMREVAAAFKHWGKTVISIPRGSAYVALKLYGEIPGDEHLRKQADSYKASAMSSIAKHRDLWRDASWMLGYNLYLQDFDDDELRAKLREAWQNGGYDGKDKYGLYWNRDAAAAAYWAAEGDHALRRKIYEELLANGTTENLHHEWIGKQQKLYSQYGIKGLFDSCDMLSLATRISPTGWRAKDRTEQIEWDEVLSMAVMDHYRKHEKGAK